MVIFDILIIANCAITALILCQFYLNVLLKIKKVAKIPDFGDLQTRASPPEGGAGKAGLFADVLGNHLPLAVLNL